MEKFRIYGDRTPVESELEKENRKLACEAASEGMVLLKNDNNLLPLKAKKITLYGAGARLTIKGGTGSGDVRERYNVNIEDGLKNNGFIIDNTNWLDRFTEKYKESKREYVEKVENAIKGYSIWKVMDMFAKIAEFKLDYPVGDLIQEEDLSKGTDTAIYVISRQVGEGFDRKLEKGDYLLSDIELENLKTCANYYKHVILIINTGSILELNSIQDLNIESIVYYGQAGEEGGNALAKIIKGDITPSGKLTDTWARDYFDYPSAKEVLDSQTKLDENYYEGIYVGYRYFDAKNIKPLFPFGFGLSYTKFNIEYLSLQLENSKVDIKFKVKNIGKEFSGKEIVQVYLAKPNKKYYGEKVSLVGFNKTNLIKPGEEEIITVTFDLKDFAVYDETNSSFVLESGEYILLYGNDSQNLNQFAVLDNKNEKIVEICKEFCSKKLDFNELKLDCHIDKNEDLPIFDLNISGCKINEYTYLGAKPQSSKIAQKLKELSDKELAMFSMGGGYFTKCFNRVEGACGNTTSKLINKGIPNIIMSDGPAGVNIVQKVAYTKRGGIKYVDELPKDWQWGWLKTLVPKMKFLYANNKHIHVYQYCTAWPNATTLAQSWNVKLVERVGEAVGKELVKFGITLWLAPALNIHRSPLCGRNFEYYSEDPLISGLMAGAITRGVQANDGVGVTIKHFACNNRETNRTIVSSNLSERSLREIYSKGFKICVKEKPKALMTSYNKINGVYAPNNKDLIIGILRNEWGYNGLVMSDWNAVDQCSIKEAIISGNNMIMPGRKDIYKKICEMLKNGELTRKDLESSAIYALNLIFEARTSKGF